MTSTRCARCRRPISRAADDGWIDYRSGFRLCEWGGEHRPPSALPWFDEFDDAPPPDIPYTPGGFDQPVTPEPDVP